MRGAALRWRKEGTGSSLQSWMPLAGPRAPGEAGRGGAQAPQEVRRPQASFRPWNGGVSDPVEIGGCRLSPRPRVRRNRASRVQKSCYPAPCARRGLPTLAAEARVCRTLVDPGRGRGPGAKGTAWGRCPRARCLQMRGPGHTGRRPGRGAGALPRLPATLEAGLGEGGPGSPRQPESWLARPEAPASPGWRRG